MILRSLFSITIGEFDASEHLPLARKIFADNKNLLVDTGKIRTNFMRQNTNKHHIDENYSNPGDVEKLKNIILNYGLQYLKDSNIDYYMDVYRYNVKNLWLNEMIGSHFQTPHHHIGYVLSGTYYVDSPEGAHPLMFYSPSYDFFPEYFVNDDRNYTAHNSSTWTMFPKSGQLFLWFSPLKHSVPSTESFEGVRRSMSFDITVE